MQKAELRRGIAAVIVSALIFGIVAFIMIAGTIENLNEKMAVFGTMVAIGLVQVILFTVLGDNGEENEEYD